MIIWPVIWAKEIVVYNPKSRFLAKFRPSSWMVQIAGYDTKKLGSKQAIFLVKVRPDP